MAKKKTFTWRDYFKTKFPQYASMFDSAEGEAKIREIFGDLVDVMIKVAEDPKTYDLSTEAGQLLFDRAVRSSKYYNESETSKKEFDALTPADQRRQLRETQADLRTRYGSLGMSETDLAYIANWVVRTKPSDTVKDYYVFGFAKGNYNITTDTAAGVSYRNLARAYNYNPSDLEDQIKSGLTGEPMADGRVVTLAGFGEKAIKQAKMLYPHLSQQLDSFSLQDLFEPYQDLAARILEKPKTAINMSDSKFGLALNASKDGQQMSITDWEYKLKSNPDYGYQYTAGAKREAKNLAAVILDIFGKTGGNLR